MDSEKRGEIYAYEELMRTRPEIGISPVDVLELAERKERLYEVEQYTFYNVLTLMKENEAIFNEKHLFINSIPTVIIKEIEFDDLLFKYKTLMQKIVVEITENGIEVFS